MGRIASFNKFSSQLRETRMNESMVKIGPTLRSMEYKNLKIGDAPENDLINKALLDDIEKASIAAGVRAKVTTANTDHPSNREFSRHASGQAVDIALLGDESMSFDKLEGSNYATENNLGNPKFKEWGDKLALALVSLGYTLITKGSTAQGESGHNKTVIWQIDKPKMGNHYNHLHISNTEGTASTAQAIVPSMTSNGANLPSKISRRGQGTEINATGELDDEFVEPPATVGSTLLRGLIKTQTGLDVGQADIRRAMELLKK